MEVKILISPILNRENRFLDQKSKFEGESSESQPARASQIKKSKLNVRLKFDFVDFEWGKLIFGSKIKI